MYPVSMIDNAVYLIGFKTIQQFPLSMAFCKQCKRIWLDLPQQSLSAIFIAIVTMVHAPIKRTIAVFTPFLIRAVARMAPCALDVFRAETTGKTTPCNTQFPFHVASPQDRMASAY